MWPNLQGYGIKKNIFTGLGIRRPTPEVVTNSLTKNGEECDCSEYKNTIDNNIVLAKYSNTQFRIKGYRGGEGKKY